jgi:hypothetical protein
MLGPFAVEAFAGDFVLATGHGLAPRYAISNLRTAISFRM